MTGRSAAILDHFVDRSLSKGTVDGRTLVARRRRDLITVYVNALGGAKALADQQLVEIRKAAELTALAEQARAKAMREGMTGGGDLTSMIRLENMAARAVRALNLPRAPLPKRPTLADYLASKPSGDAA